MKIGVPKEIKTLEFRVGMVPGGVRELVHDGRATQQPEQGFHLSAAGFHVVEPSL